MASFTNHNDTLERLKEDQDAEHDNREKVREVHHFLDKPDGQWEPDVFQAFSGRPRYTFDKSNDLVDSITGHIEQADFGIRVKPAGGDATTDIAKTYDGLIRNIQTISNAGRIYSKAARNMVAAGLDGWEVVQDWASDDSFEQDLLVQKVPNWVDCVWFDATAVEETMFDARWAFKLKSMGIEDYKEQFPKGSEVSVSDERTTEVYHHKATDTITIGSFYYKDKAERELVLMSNGHVHIVDDKFEQIMDELGAQNVTEVRRRTREIDEIKIRLFDGSDWLNDAQDTVFQLLPLIPSFGNFKISENKVIYWGVITKKMDEQRVLNYAQSRKIEMNVLTPREKIAMTLKQQEGLTEELATLNTDSSPILTYNPDSSAGAIPPYKIAGPGLDPTLSEIALNMQQGLASGINVPGQAPGLRSGVAVELEQDDEDIKDVKYFGSQEAAICHTARVLITAIPRAYDSRRQIRLLAEDGTTEMVTLHESVRDDQTGQMVEINDLSQGIYDVTCIVGPAFKNRQSEMTAGFLEAAQIDPSLMQLGQDIWLKNQTTPGMDLIAERAREQAFNQGIIPEDQWTDEEREKVQQAQAQAAQNPPPQDPLMIAAQAEQTKADTQAQEAAGKLQLQEMDLQNKSFALQLKERELDANEQKEQIQLVRDQQTQQSKLYLDSVEGLTKLIEGFGIEALGGRAPATLIEQGGALVDQKQDEIN